MDIQIVLTGISIGFAASVFAGLFSWMLTLVIRIFKNIVNTR